MPQAGERELDKRGFQRAAPSGVRLLAGMALAAWWLMMFGLIDLLLPFDAPAPGSEFYTFVMLETGWGLLYAVLLGGAALALLVRPLSPEPALQHVVVGAAIALAAIATFELGHLLPAFMAAGVGLGALAITGDVAHLGRTFIHPPRGLWWLPAAALAVALGPAVGYALSSFRAAWAGEPDDITSGLTHWPGQGAFFVAFVFVALLAVLRRRGRIPAYCAAFSAGWFGAVSIAYPEPVGSLGVAWGVAAITWALVYLTSWEAALRFGQVPTSALSPVPPAAAP